MMTISTTKLRQILIDYFDESELQNLTFDLGVDYENLPGKSKGDKARELIAFLDRRSRIHELVQICYQLRPKAPWPTDFDKETNILQAQPPSPPTGRHRDNFAHYEIGLTNLLVQMGQDHPRYVEGLGYQTRLQENINWVRHHGDSESRRSERSATIAQLNDLTLSTLGKSFNELCSSH
jgi:hypothetical protein